MLGWGDTDGLDSPGVGPDDDAPGSMLGVLRVRKRAERNAHDLLRSLERLPEITSCEVLDVDDSLLLRVRVRDAAHFAAVVTFFRRQGAVAEVRSSLARPVVTDVLQARPAR